MTGFVVANQDQTLFIKRTSRSGLFYGKTYLTSDEKEARVWTRRKDAVRACRVVFSRGKAYSDCVTDRNLGQCVAVNIETREVIDANQAS